MNILSKSLLRRLQAQTLPDEAPQVSKIHPSTQDFLKTFTRLSLTFLITIWWLSHNYLITFLDFLMTFSWHSNNFLMIFSLLSDDFLMTFSWHSHDFLITFSWLSDNFLIIISWLFLDFLINFLWFSHGLLMNFS